MAATKLSDVIIPEVFQPYVVQKSLELSELFSSGIIATDRRVIPGDRAGGEQVNMPYWNDLTGDAEELSDGKDLALNAITAAQDVSVVQALGKIFAANDLTYALTGDDPMRVVADLFAAWWARQMQKRLLAVLKGAFAAASMSGQILDISGGTGDAAKIDKSSFADAIFKLGDAAGQLTAMAMHSATYAKLYKDDLLDTVRGADGIMSTTYQGKRVIIDDGMPLTSTVYTSYLFGPGAIAYAEGNPKVPVASFRKEESSVDALVNRRHFVLHPRGVKWAGTAIISTGDGSSGHPTLSDLETGTNWVRVYDNKAIRMIAFKHKV